MNEQSAIVVDGEYLISVHLRVDQRTSPGIVEEKRGSRPLLGDGHALGGVAYHECAACGGKIGELRSISGKRMSRDIALSIHPEHLRTVASSAEDRTVRRVVEDT